MRSRRLVGILTICVVLLGALVSAGATERISLATGGTAGTYYPIGSAMASIITKHVPGVEVTAEATGASVANMRMMASGQVELMMGASTTVFGGYSGQPPFEKEPVKNIRGVMSLYPEIFQFIVLKDSPMKNLYDLKGKKVAVGAPGSGTEVNVKLIMQAHGLEYSDFSPQFLNFGEAVTALKDRIVDCAVVAAGVPTSAVVDVSTSLDVRLLDLDTKVMEEFLKDRPFLHITQIPKGTYRGIDVDVSAAASPALLVARDDVKEEMVYAITKAVFDNLDTIVASHVQGKMLKLETALNAMSIPLHPGAEKYYKEMGVLK